MPIVLITSENVPVSLFSSVDLPTDGKPEAQRGMLTSSSWVLLGLLMEQTHSQKEQRLTDQAHPCITNLVDIKACMAAQGLCLV